MSSKRRGGGGGGQDEEPRPSRRHRHRHRRRHGHLYLVLDDWKNGLSVHKIDPDTLEVDEAPPAGAGAGAEQPPQHLPEPPVLRLESPSPTGSAPGASRMFFSALGTKLFVLMNQRCALVYDTETAAVSVGPHAPARMLCGSGVTVPAGGMLYALSHRYLDREDPHSFQVMVMDEDDPDPQGQGRWSWKTLPEPPPAFTIRQIVVSHALHPDGRTIFMTTADRGEPGEALGTYSFNTQRSEWRHHGDGDDWALPFRGQGYFDRDLDAWVGLHRDGYVCACQVASRSRSRSSSTGMMMMTKEKVAYDCEDRWDRNIRASLTYMGTSSSNLYCVVETVLRDEDVEQDYYVLGQQDGFLLRITMFGLEYDRSGGELRITNRRSTRSYLVSRHRCYFRPFALYI